MRALHKPKMDQDAVSKIAETLGRLDARMENIEKAVLGNGQPGLIQRITTIEAQNSKFMGGISVLGVLGAGVWGFFEWLFHMRGQH